MRKLSVNTGMSSRPTKQTVQAKRVQPPAVPDVYRHSGSSFGSAGYGSSTEDSVGGGVLGAGGFLVQAPSTMEQQHLIGPASAAGSLQDDHSDYGSTFSKSPIILPTNSFVAQSANAFQFPAIREPLTHKAAVYYHQQLALQEDQGIDLTQSPGRDSPGSSSGSAGSGSRHSTASLDSGRASSYHTHASSSGSSLSGVRGGGGGGGGGAGGVIAHGNAAVTLSSPRCSVSSCSIGSVDRMNQRTDHEVISDWLKDIFLEEYAQLFSAAGYDLPTISRMTPEDLTAIGIKKPHHREKIKQHIDQLHLLDNLPNNVPGSIDEWLRLLRLDEYVQSLFAQGYQTVRDVTQLPWEDMEDIGIVKLGHQKKLLLAIKRVKDIINGKWLAPPSAGLLQSHLQQHLHCTQNAQQQAKSPTILPLASPAWSLSAKMQYIKSAPPISSAEEDLLFYQQRQQHLHQFAEWQQQQMMMNVTNQNGGDASAKSKEAAPSSSTTNDIVLIKLRQPRGKSLESLEDPNEQRNSMMANSHLTFSTAAAQRQQLVGGHHHYEQQYYNNSCAPGAGGSMVGMGGQYFQQMPWRRSYDDGDITPTNEMAASINSSCDQGGGTLPRHHRVGVQQQRFNQQQQLQLQQRIGAAPMLTLNNCLPLQQQQQFHHDKLMMNQTKCYVSHTAPGSPMMSTKKQPPEPPRRQCSVSSSTTSAATEQNEPHFVVVLDQQYSPLHSKQQLEQQQNYLLMQQLQQQQHSLHRHPATILQQQQQQHVQHQPLYANYAVQQQQQQQQQQMQQHQTTVEIHAEKTHDSKSNSSIDSIDAIPFANDNAGTIKQRAMNRIELQSSLSSSSSSSSSLATTVANIGQSSASLASMQQRCGGGGTTTTTPSPTLSSTSSMGGAAVVDGSNSAAVAAQAPAAAAAAAKVIDTNVLNDIGNMLANLTDELDAMLEEEKRAGLNDTNTMAERDLGSTFLLPHTHLYKPDRGSDISGFDSL